MHEGAPRGTSVPGARILCLCSDETNNSKDYNDVSEICFRRKVHSSPQRGTQPVVKSRMTTTTVVTTLFSSSPQQPAAAATAKIPSHPGRQALRALRSFVSTVIHLPSSLRQSADHIVHWSEHEHPHLDAARNFVSSVLHHDNDGYTSLLSNIPVLKQSKAGATSDEDYQPPRLVRDR